jgi:hypothetical protein
LNVFRIARFHEIDTVGPSPWLVKKRASNTLFLKMHEVNLQPGEHARFMAVKPRRLGHVRPDGRTRRTVALPDVRAHRGALE